LRASVETLAGTQLQSVTTLTEGQSAIESSVGSVRADLSDAEERLADLIGGLNADVGRMRSDLLTNKNNISDTRDALAASRLEVASVTAQSDDLKASFLLTRDTVAENRADIETVRTSSAEAEQITLVSHLFVIWLQTTYDTAAEGAVQEALRRSIVATGNIALEEAWAEIPSSLGLYAQVQTDDALEDFPDKLDVFHDPLSRRLVDALGG
jgi:chromosome segregation ATPase